ncbi:hypothetical protein [Sphingosinicella sp. BN140058]|uniref:hypothetical protein n=1 Tax=Sphingosinicella sp. BN140058 TaxID=1892855 RepID=UPI001011E6BC|nr:hypothetical protein [Sphingosinicella sp. BN140058]QAY77224.1 hypothetical protein ETR14_12485 [Sphingosinicella sp. BN140058]
MRAFLTVALSAMLTAAAPAPTDQQAQLDAALERGRRLYEIDIAGWVSTDAMLAKAPETRQWPIRGWLVEPDPDRSGTWLVTYYLLPHGPDGEALPAFRARVANGQVSSAEVVPVVARTALQPAQMRIVRAIEAARKLDLKSCTGARLNVTVIPPASATAPLEVYLLTPQTDEKVFPVGGHYKAVFAPDGHLVSQRKFSNACLNMDGRASPKGAAMFVTHLLDKIPTEIHVLLSIQTGTPLMVGMTNKDIWSVTPQRIEKVGRL